MTVEAIRQQALFLTDTADVLSVQFYEDGAAGDPGVTTVAVATEAGATVIASTQASGTGTGVRSVALTGTHTANLDRMVATWTTTNYGVHVTRFEVVGAYLFSLYDARRFRANKAGGAPLQNRSTYPTEEIEAARVRITEQFEELLGYPPIPRYRLTTVDGPGLTSLSLGSWYVSRIRSIETRTSGVWTAYTEDELADVVIGPGGVLHRETRGVFTSGSQNVRIGYEAGPSSVHPDITQAGLLALVWDLVESNVSDRAISVSGELGTTQLWTPGISARGKAQHPLPEVDRLLGLHAINQVVIA